MDKRSLSERDICTKFITPAVRQAGWDEMLADPRGGQLHQGPHHRPRQAGHARQGQARRLHPLLQAEHPDRADRGQGQQPQRRRRHAAGARLRRRRSTSRSSSPRTATASCSTTAPARARRSRANLALDAFPSPAELWARYRAWKGLTPEAEQIVLQDYYDDGSGKAPALLPGQRRQRRDRGHRQGPGPRPAGHGDRHRQDLHRLPDHLAAVEGRPQEAHPVPRRPQRPRSTRRWSTTSGRSARRWRSSAPAPRPSSATTAPTVDLTTRARQEAADRHRLRDLSRPLPGDHRPRGAAEALPRVLARLLRPDRDRRVPPRQRRRGFGLARDPRVLLVRHADRPDRHAEGDRSTSPTSHYFGEPVYTYSLKQGIQRRLPRALQGRQGPHRPRRRRLPAREGPARPRRRGDRGPHLQPARTSTARWCSTTAPSWSPRRSPSS